jgi:hypothetical protein
MKFGQFSFGSIRIDGVTHECDVVIDGGKVRRRGKKPSKKYRDNFGHPPVSVEEEIPWNCRRLVIGTGTGALPVMEEVKEEAKRRKVKLVVLPTSEAIRELEAKPKGTNAIRCGMWPVSIATLRKPSPTVGGGSRQGSPR